MLQRNSQTKRGFFDCDLGSEAFLIRQMSYITCEKCREISSSSKKFPEIKPSEI